MSHILVDMDDTIVEWGEAKDAWLRQEYPELKNFLFGDLQTGWDMNEGLDDEHVKALRTVMDTPGFYADMDAVPAAAVALSAMVADGHRVTIVSTPWESNPTCLQDKYDWLEKNIGAGWGSKLILTRDKTAIRGDYLFDDKPEIKGAYRPEWQQIVVDRPHNRYLGDKLPRAESIREWYKFVQSPELGPLIGLGGLKTSGKDAFADELVDFFGFKKMGMSDPLLEALEALNPLIPIEDTTEWMRVTDYVERVGYVEAKRNSEVRVLLQRLGTQVGRDLLGENTWTDLAARRIQEERAGGNPVVITGMRFPNELEMIRQLGGEAVWIDRPGLTANDSHASENSVHAGDFDLVIHNDGDLLDLEYEALSFGNERSWDRL